MKAGFFVCVWRSDTMTLVQNPGDCVDVQSKNRGGILKCHERAKMLKQYKHGYGGIYLYLILYLLASLSGIWIYMLSLFKCVGNWFVTPAKSGGGSSCSRCFILNESTSVRAPWLTFSPLRIKNKPSGLFVCVLVNYGRVHCGWVC